MSDKKRVRAIGTFGGPGFSYQVRGFNSAGESIAVYDPQKLGEKKVDERKNLNEN